ncbi:MAG: ATP-binding protein [Bacteriovoracia bacterium]
MEVAPLSEVPPVTKDILFAGKYQLTSILGEKERSRSYAGFDVVTGQSIVLKTFSDLSVSAQLLFQLEHESEILKGAKDSGLNPILHYGIDEKKFFLVSPFIPGVSLDERLKQRTLTVSEVIFLAKSILKTLGEIHALKSTFRNLKPSNIIVNKAGTISEVTLVDFGAYADNGDIRYFSPEQAGLLNSTLVDSRSDFYSLGSVLHEALSGKILFDEANLSEILRQHLIKKVPSINSMGICVPKVLDEIVSRLLKINPQDRYQTVDAIFHDFERLSAALSQGETEPVFVVGSKDRRRFLTEPEFVGRSKELDSLYDGFKSACNGNGKVLFVEGDSGVGKSWLIERFTSFYITGRDVRVLRAQGKDKQANQPFSMIRNLGLDIISFIDSRPTLKEKIKKELYGSKEEICSILPELKTIWNLTGTSHIRLDDKFVENRFILSFHSFLKLLGSKEEPLVILLDDLQWADDLTLKLLVHLNTSDLKDTFLFIVGALRSRDGGTSVILDKIKNLKNIRLEPLRKNEIADLLRSMAGDLPDNIVDTVYEIAKGSPFNATAVLQGLSEMGALFWQNDAWQFNAEAISQMQVSRRAATILAKRLDLLPTRTRELMTIAAIVGKAFTIELVSELLEVSATDVFQDLDLAIRRNLIRRSHQDLSVYIFAHDKIREKILADAPVEKLRRLHYNVAEKLESLDRNNIFEISYHWDAANEPARAYPYAITAARQALNQCAFEAAEQQFRIALRRGEETALLEGLAESLYRRGLYRESYEHFLNLKNRATSDLDKARYVTKLASVVFGRSDLGQAIQFCQEGLRLVGCKIPATRWSLCFALAKEVFVQILHTYFPRKSERELSSRDLLELDLYTHLGYLAWFDAKPLLMSWVGLKKLNVAERFKPSVQLVLAYAVHAVLLSAIPLTRRAQRYCKKAFEILDKEDDLLGRGYVLDYYSVALMTAGNIEEAQVAAKEAMNLLAKAGDVWESNNARLVQSNAAYFLGNLEEAVRLSQEVHQIGAQVSSTQSMGLSLTTWSLSSGGRIPAHILDEEMSRFRGNDIQTKAHVLGSHGIQMLLGERDPEKAVQSLRRAVESLRSRTTRNVFVSPFFFWYVTAIRQLAEKTSPHQVEKRRELINLGFRELKKSWFLARAFKSRMPHALREKALLYSLVGKVEKSRNLISRSIRAAEKHKLKIDVAESTFIRGKLGLIHGWPNSQKEYDEGRHALWMMGASFLYSEEDKSAHTNSVALFDRFSSALDEGRKISSVLSKEKVADVVRNSANVLLRCESSIWIDVAELRNSGLPWQKEIARKTLSSRRPTCFSADEVDASSDLHATGILSGICSVIYVRGNPAAYFFAIQKKSPCFFGDEERKIAEFIATLAGAALENAEGLDKAKDEVSRRDEFMSIASHELKTPITALQLQIQIMLRLARTSQNKPELVDRMVRLAGQAETQVHQITKLINNLLDVSKLEEKKNAIQFQKANLSEIVRNVVNQYLASGFSADELILEAEPHISGFWDVDGIEQVVNNLIANAVKYGQKKSVFVSVAKVSRGFAEISVQDQGIGISPEDQERIFYRFERAVSSRNFGGLGLGLYIVRNIVEAHNGNIQVFSRLNQGAKFVVRLPCS